MVLFQPVTQQYINAVLGLSALRFDNKYLGGLSGERNGKQVFGTKKVSAGSCLLSVDYRTELENLLME
jgi:hypothetical protein